MKDWQMWADRLIAEGELDPLYNGLKGARTELGDEFIGRFCLSMVMFYNIEEAFHMASLGKYDFWEYGIRGWDSIRRGEEARHFRGKQGLDSYLSLKHWDLSPEDTLFRPYDKSYNEFYKNVKIHSMGYGPYKILKWGDFLANVFDMEMDFRSLDKHLPDGSLQGLRYIHPDPLYALDMAKNYIHQYEVPWGGRRCSWSEAETVGCGFKVYGVGTKYKFGYDIHHYRQQLLSIGTPKAKVIAGYLPIETPEWRKDV